MVKCHKCGYEFIAEEKLTICPQCFYQFDTGKEYRIEPKKSSAKPIIAGILLIIVSLSTLFIVIALYAAPTLLEHYHLEQMQSSLYGRVVDKNGTGIEDVTIELNDLVVKTNSTGYYKLENVRGGLHKIKIYKPNNKTIIAKIFVLPRNEAENFELIPGEGIIEEDHTLELFAVLYSCATIELIFSVFALVGGVLAIKRRHFAVCVVGSVVGLLSLLVVVGTIMSIAALILLALSKEEFKS
ncbi:MAG: hypothetical protein QME47_03255 [Candidatus Thermoplasmatota archaeon]|nr:hypothetical protein [Candidatus Thermoplasmatota archaeon]